MVLSGFAPVNFAYACFFHFLLFLLLLFSEMLTNLGVDLILSVCVLCILSFKLAAQSRFIPYISKFTIKSHNHQFAIKSIYSEQKTMRKNRMSTLGF